jgi:hypothetical protein
MKKLLFMAVLLVATACVVSAEEAAKPAAPAVAVKEESPDTGFSFGATLDLYSAYVWRGVVINDRPVWQPGATVSYATGDYGTFSANVWANFDVTDRTGHRTGGGLNEIDYTLSYAIDVGPVSLAAGHIWYTFPKASGQDYFSSTREVYATAQYNNDIVNPFVKVYYDYDLIEGFYGNAGLNKSVDITDRFSVGSEVSVGAGDDDYMAGYFAADNAGLADFNAAVFCSYALTDNLSVGARLAWMSVIDDDARDNAADTDIVWGGVNLAASF